MLRRLSLPLVLLAALAAAPSAHAAKGMEIGIQDDAVLLSRYWGNVDYTYARARDMHATRQRIIVHWVRTLVPSQRAAKRKPKRLRYDWSSWDTAVRTARSHGFKVQLVLSGAAPAWADARRRLEPPGSRVPNTSVKPNAASYGRWVGAAVKHFRRLGVQRYSLWNEPNHTDTLKPLGQAAAIYRGLWAKGSAAARKAYPKAQILFGELAPSARRGIATSPLAFLRTMLCVNRSYTKRARRCPRATADGFGMHPYDNFRRRRGRDDVTMNSLGNLVRALDKLGRLGALRKRGGGKLGIYLDEFGYLYKLQPSQRGPGAITEPRRPAAIRAALDTALRNPRVKQLLWYGLIEPPANSTSNWYAFLVHLDGRLTNSFRAFRDWARAHRGKLAR